MNFMSRDWTFYYVWWGRVQKLGQLEWSMGSIEEKGQPKKHTLTLRLGTIHWPWNQSQRNSTLDQLSTKTSQSLSRTTNQSLNPKPTYPWAWNPANPWGCPNSTEIWPIPEKSSPWKNSTPKKPHISPVPVQLLGCPFQCWQRQPPSWILPSQ